MHFPIEYWIRKRRNTIGNVKSSNIFSRNHQYYIYIHFFIVDDEVERVCEKWKTHFRHGRVFCTQSYSFLLQLWLHSQRQSIISDNYLETSKVRKMNKNMSNPSRSEGEVRPSNPTYH